MCVVLGNVRLELFLVLFRDFFFKNDNRMNYVDLIHISLLQILDFPGGKIKFTPSMRFIPESAEERIPCYRVIGEDGKALDYNNLVQVCVYIYH